MPIEFTPPHRLLTAYLRLRERLRGQKPQANSIKAGTIDAVNDDGSYTVEGRQIHAVGNAAMSAGERVDVAWKDGRPKVILAHNVRRAQFVDPLAGNTFPVVEELILPDGGTDRRLWFRNGTDFRPILFNAQATDLRNIGGQLIQVEEVFWGKTSPNHFVIIGRRDSDTFHAIAVYNINRPRANQPFPPGFNIKPTLLKLYILEDPLGPSFGTLSVNNGDVGASNPLRAFAGAGVASSVIFTGPNGPTAAQVTVSALCQAVYQSVTPDGNLILRQNISFAVSISGPEAGQDTFVNGNIGTQLINLTRGTVLAAHAPDRAVPLFVRLQNSMTPPDPQTFACFSVRTATISTGHTLDALVRGDASVISIKMVGPGPSSLVPTLNQYALVEHEDLSADGTSGGAFQNPAVCYPNGGDAFSGGNFRIVGEFAQVISALVGGGLLTAQRVNFQTSRTHMFWAKIANNTYIIPLELFLTDLRVEATAKIGEQPALVLLNPGAIPQFQTRQMIAVRSGLILAPRGPAPVPPPPLPTPPPFYNVQFFVSGGAAPPKPGQAANIINQAALKENKALHRVAQLKVVKITNIPETLIVTSEDQDIQTLNAESLGSFRSGSAL